MVRLIQNEAEVVSMLRMLPEVDVIGKSPLQEQLTLISQTEIIIGKC